MRDSIFERDDDGRFAAVVQFRGNQELLSYLYTKRLVIYEMMGDLYSNSEDLAIDYAELQGALTTINQLIKTLEPETINV